MVTAGGAQLPVGIVTLLFSDIEGSTQLLRDLGDGYGDVLADHDRILHTVWTAHRGVVVHNEGDAFFVAFADPADAVRAATEAQRALHEQDWPARGRVRVRIGIHTGSPRVREGDYWGIDVHYAHRLCSAGHGGQILLSDSTAPLVGGALEDLGEHAIRDFPSARRIFHVPVDGRGRTSFPAPRTLRAGRTNLPDHLSSFVGRTQERSVLQDMLTYGVVTLTGPGGVGKTRLALQLGSDLLDGSGDGVWLADLAPLLDPALVAATVAKALGVIEQPGRPMLDTLSDAIRDRNLLLILDNCEHVLPDAARLAGHLARTCARLVILATSREPLGIEGEYVFRVPPLELPPAGGAPETLLRAEAVVLLRERARQHRAGFTLREEEAALAARVCRSLDGIPLAIELAAARLRSLSLDQLEARLDHRFRLLSGGTRSALPRQQTLRALIDWSYELLSEREREMLARLAVFAGGCDLEAAEAVCAADAITREEVLDLVFALVDKSLLQAEEPGGVLRYRLLESVRQYAAEKLAERGASEVELVRARHRDHYLTLAERADAELWQPDQRLWLDRLETEHDNLRAALAFSFEDADAEPALRLATGLATFRRNRGFAAEGAAALEEALRLADGCPPERRAPALFAASRLLETVGELGAAERRAGEALAVARKLGDTRLTVQALRSLAFVAFRHGEYGRTLALTGEALDLAAPLGDRHLLGLVQLAHASAVLHSGGDAEAAFEHAVDLVRDSGDHQVVAVALGNLGSVELAAGKLTAARAHLEDAVSILRELRSFAELGFQLHNLALACHLQGESAAARRQFGDVVTLARRLGDRLVMAYGLLGVALVSASTDPTAAAALHGAADGLGESLGVQFGPPEAELREQDQRRLRGMIGEGAFTLAYRRGRTLGSDELFEVATALTASP